MIGINHFEYEDENEITNSKDEQLNNDDLNNKVDININYNYNNIKKAIKQNIYNNNTNNNNLSLSSSIKKKKRVKLKNNNLNSNKIQSNPFLIQNSFPAYNNQKKKLKTLAASVYFIKFKANTKNNNLIVKNENLLGKSIFSKISENLLENDKKSEKSNKKIKSIEQINEDNYNQLTEELYLHYKANNPTNENNKIISEFLKRKKKEEISKKIHMENDDWQNMTQTLKDLKRAKTLTDRNRRYKSTRTFFEFLQDQKDKEEKHQFLLKKNEIMQQEKMNLNYREKPLLNKESIKIINKSVRDKMNIHMKLYQDFNQKKKREEEKEKEKLILKKNNNEKKISKKKIEENSNRLYNEYKIKKEKNEEIQNKIINEIKNMNFNSVSKNSNDIIYKKLIKKIKSAITDLFGKKIEDEFDINYNEFLKLLYNIGFISNNYFDLKEKNNIIDDNNKIKNYLDSEIEYKLSKEAWKIIVNNKEFINDNNIKGNSKKVIFFIISTLGLYNEEIDNKYIKNELQKSIIEINPININLSLSSQIYKSFHLYRNCAINILLSREEKNKNITIINENEKIKQEKATKNIIHKNNFINNKAYTKNDFEFFKAKKLKRIDVNKDSQEKNADSYIPIPICSHNKKNEKVGTHLDKNTKKFLDKSFHQENNDNRNIYHRNDHNLINSSFNSNNLRKMFLNNPLENDDDIQKKIKGLKEARNKRKIDQIIKEKGIRINNIENNNNLYDYNYDYSQRFVYTDEPLNNFKNTFKKYEKSSLKKRMMKKEKYIFEIFVEKQPKKLIIYKGDDINLKIKEFCCKYNLDYNDKKLIINNINQQIKVIN